MAVSLHTPSGNINTVPEIKNSYAQWQYYHSPYLSTTEMEKHIHTPGGHINTVPINLTYMLSDNLNTCAINKYTNTLRGNDNRTAATW